MFEKIDPKSSKKRSRGGPGVVPGASRGGPGNGRNAISKKTPKKYEKSREHDENWGPQNHRFFCFSRFFDNENKL